MVTLLGFFFILGNVALLVIADPDMSNTVRISHLSGVSFLHNLGSIMDLFQLRLWRMGVQHYGQH